MFCPKCRCEYNAGIYKCPDCSIKLVEVLHAEKNEKLHEARSFDTIVLTIVETQVEGQVLAGMLSSEGIECFVKQHYIDGPRMAPVMPSDMPLVNTAFMTVGLYGWGALVVNKDKAERALEVLKDFKKSQELEE
jgi:hypothetical protein